MLAHGRLAWVGLRSPRCVGYFREPNAVSVHDRSPYRRTAGTAAAFRGDWPALRASAPRGAPPRAVCVARAGYGRTRARPPTAVPRLAGGRQCAARSHVLRIPPLLLAGLGRRGGTPSHDPGHIGGTLSPDSGPSCEARTVGAPREQGDRRDYASPSGWMSGRPRVAADPARAIPHRVASAAAGQTPVVPSAEQTAPDRSPRPTGLVRAAGAGGAPRSRAP